MTDPEALRRIVAEGRELMKHVPEGPWFAAEDDADDVPDHRKSGLALVDTGRREDWPIARLTEWRTAKLLAYLGTHLPAILSALEDRALSPQQTRDAEAEDIIACIQSTTWGGWYEIVEMIRRRIKASENGS